MSVAAMDRLLGAASITHMRYLAPGRSGMAWWSGRPIRGDRRSSRFEVVPAARQQIPAARRALGAIAEQALGDLDPGERSVLLKALRRMARNLGGEPDDFGAP